MARMFNGAKAFNAYINHWDVRSVFNMNSMFLNAFAFNQALPDWDVSNVEIMRATFSFATKFEGWGLGKWQVAKVMDMSNMFSFAKRFDEDISGRFLPRELHRSYSSFKITTTVSVL